MGPFSIEGLIVPEALSRVVRIPEANIGDLWSLHTHNPSTLSLLYDKCLASLLKGDHELIYLTEAGPGIAKGFVELTVERR